MDSFSVRRFLLLLVVLSIGVGIGAGLERWFRPPPQAIAAPVAPPAAAAPVTLPALPHTLAVDARMSFRENLSPSLMLSLGASFPDYMRCLTIRVSHSPAGKPVHLRIA